MLWWLALLSIVGALLLQRMVRELPKDQRTREHWLFLKWLRENKGIDG